MKIIMRGAAEWSLNDQVLKADAIGIEAIRIENDGSLVFETDPDSGQAIAKFKSGDGQTSWNALPYAEHLLLVTNSDSSGGGAGNLLPEQVKERLEEIERTAGNAMELAKSAQETAKKRHAANHALNGNDLLTPPSIGAAEKDHTHNDLKSVPGDIRLWPFRPEQLPFGWYFANGDQFPLDSPQGDIMYGLSDEYKKDWNIIISGPENEQIINLPNCFHADGRGFFFRAVDGISRNAGSIENDAIGEHYHFVASTAFRNASLGVWIGIEFNWTQTLEV